MNVIDEIIKVSNNDALEMAKASGLRLGVVYGGDRFSVFSEDSAPVQVDLTLQFKEVQLLAQSDMINGY